MAGIVLTFENGRSAIKAIGDLAGGWQRDKNTHAFYGMGFLDFAGDIRVQVTLQVHARPNDCGKFLKQFPRSLEAHGGDESLRYDLRDGKLEVFADLRSNLVWLSGAKKPGVNWRPVRGGKKARNSRLHFCMKQYPIAPANHGRLFS